MLKTHNQPVLMKVFLLMNILIGASVGAYFSWEVIVYCGNILIGVALSGFLFAFISAFLLATKRILTRCLIFFLGILILVTLAFPLASFKSVDDASLCGWQFCLGQNVNNQDFIKQFKSKDTSYNSNFCNHASNDSITFLLIAFYFGQYGKDISQNDITNISEGLPMAALAVQSLFSLITFLIFVVFVFKHRKDNSDRLLP